MPPKRGKVQKEEVQVSLGPQLREGEVVFGVAHIFASFNDTFVHVTDRSLRQVCLKTIVLANISRIRFNMQLFLPEKPLPEWLVEWKSKQIDRDEASPYAAMLAAQVKSFCFL